jgi:hypothetical protein
MVHKACEAHVRLHEGACRRSRRRCLVRSLSKPRRQASFKMNTSSTYVRFRIARPYASNSGPLVIQRQQALYLQGDWYWSSSTEQPPPTEFTRTVAEEKRQLTRAWLSSQRRVGLSQLEIEAKARSKTGSVCFVSNIKPVLVHSQPSRLSHAQGQQLPAL